jgi:hypothetical protein
MIEFPDHKKAFSYEDNFLLTCKPTRIAKIIGLYETFKLASKVPGAIVECGVFKGSSFCIFAILRSLLENVWKRKLVAFDTFEKFADTPQKDDSALRSTISTLAGLDCISAEQLMHALKLKGGGSSENVELISGDILTTVPEFVINNPGLRIALLSIDVDFEEPTRVIIEALFPLVVSGGVVLFDDYGSFPGATRAIDEFLKKTGYQLKTLGFTRHPCFIIKL